MTDAGPVIQTMYQQCPAPGCGHDLQEVDGLVVCVGCGFPPEECGIRALSSRLRSWAQESLVNHQIGSATITMALDAAQAIEDLLARLEPRVEPVPAEEP